jgi:hypothetical protein
VELERLGDFGKAKQQVFNTFLTMPGIQL